MRLNLHAGEELLALERNHDGYYFDPGKMLEPEQPASWAVSLLPRSDGALLVAQDFRFGWIESVDGVIVAFGESFVESLLEAMPALFKTT